MLRWDVLEQHLEEASFLWTQWENGLQSASYTLAEVAQGDERRLLAHLDALVVGGRRVSSRLLAPALKGDDAERVRVASFALLADGDGEDTEAVLRMLAEGDEDQVQGIQRSMEVSPRETLTGSLLPLLARGEAALVQRLLDILGFRQVHPGPVLAGLLLHDAPEVKAAALRAARLWPAQVAPACVREALVSPIPRVREAAIQLGLLCGMRDVWEACQQRVQDEGPGGELARLALSMGGQDADLRRLLKLLSVPALRRDTLWALGFSGRLVVADACLEWLDVPGSAAVAAEAFCAITGLVLRGELVRKREGDPPDELLPLEEDLDVDLMPVQDAELVRPEPAAVRSWWSRARKDFNSDTRYLAGKPFTPVRLMDALEWAPMRRRATLSLELAIRSRRGFWVETQELSHRQYRQLQGARRTLERALAMGPFAEWMRG